MTSHKTMIFKEESPSNMLIKQAKSDTIATSNVFLCGLFHFDQLLDTVVHHFYRREFTNSETSFV